MGRPSSVTNFARSKADREVWMPPPPLLDGDPQGSVRAAMAVREFPNLFGLVLGRRRGRGLGGGHRAPGHPLLTKFARPKADPEV